MKVLRSIPIAVRSSYFNVHNWQPFLLLNLLVGIWIVSSAFLHRIDPTMGVMDQTIWLLILISLIGFLLIVALSWWLLNQFLMIIGLPLLSSMVSQFYDLSLWQQFVFYLASFGILLLSGAMCFIAIC